eukprot:CAMPEP_0179286744 /NCGR_PEP_ID=MMETSP0797-20121207/39905_1 /TAXON_ID=47934 /ORGANISM="Dinophysis acuminata, Strain DAEP01" /LENGTH=36 /DNA_ID= /DNA_START= /DNA_END= /DNA_ORIENTATION=
MPSKQAATQRLHAFAACRSAMMVFRSSLGRIALSAF